MPPATGEGLLCSCYGFRPLPRCPANHQLPLAGRGEFIVVLDSQDRENEGDLIIAAEDLTESKMSFMVRHTRYEAHSSQTAQTYLSDVLD